MSVPCPVNVIWDLTSPILPCSHMYIVPPMPSPTPTVAIEMLATQMWTAGYVLNKNKWAKTVKHKGVFIAQEGHDLGPLIPDVTIPFVNAWYAVMWPFSSRKIMFSASKVKMDKAATGCASVWPPFVMLTCGEPISLPVTAPLTNMLNSVYVGMTMMDILAGVLSILTSMAIDFIFSLIGYKGGAKKYGRELRNIFKRIGRLPVHRAGSLFGGRVGQKVSKAIIEKFFTPKDLVKNLVSGVTGFGISSLTGDPKFSMGVGNPWLGGEFSYDMGSDEGGHRKGLGGEFHVLGTQVGNDGVQQWGSKL